MFMRRWGGLLGMALVAGASVGPDRPAWPRLVSMAAAQGVSQERAFDIPAQSLEAALDAFSSASRIQVLYETPLAAERRSREVRGRYTPDIALGLLLADTGLDFAYTTDGAITLVARALDANAQIDSERRRHLAKFDHFLGGVQAGIFAALCRHADARPGDFRLAIRFWVATSGAIVKPALLNSTGRPSRDAAIAGILGRLSFSEAPPFDMPQPITMVLTETALTGDRDRCAGTQDDWNTPPQAARK